jgi:hypothetical protein
MTLKTAYLDPQNSLFGVSFLRRIHGETPSKRVVQTDMLRTSKKGLFLDLQDHQKLISLHLTIGQNRDPDPDSQDRPNDGHFFGGLTVNMTKVGNSDSEDPR